MPVTDVFRTACWNFVGGDRAIEGILRDLPAGAGLVVRNRLAYVLPTAAALADLAGARGRSYHVRVPANAWQAPELDLAALIAPADLPGLLLARLWGLSMADLAATPESGTVLVAAGFAAADAAAAARLAAWLDRHPAVQAVFVAPPGQLLAGPLRPHAAQAWSAQHGGGLNAFAKPTVEEAAFELAPTRILVAAPDPATAMYTAVGAADAFIRQAAAREGLAGFDARQAGARVAVLSGIWEAPAGAPAPVAALLDAHLRQALGVADSAPDPGVRLSGEAIAIDLG